MQLNLTGFTHDPRNLTEMIGLTPSKTWTAGERSKRTFDRVLTNRGHYPVLIVGTGIAGLTAAFCLAGMREGLRINTTDKKFTNFLKAIGHPVDGF